MNFHFINQLKYPDMPYFTGIGMGGLPEDKNNIAVSGCGVCCFVMCVEAMTGRKVPLDVAIGYAVESGATVHYGTDLDVLLNYALPKYGMSFEITDDVNKLKKWIEDGGIAVANTGGDRDGYSCPFSPRGHYVLVYDVQGDECKVFDTAFRMEKYEKAKGDGLLRVDSNTVITAPLSLLDRACDNKRPRYCLVK